MADFKCWSNENLVAFCEEAQRELVKLNDEKGVILRSLHSLMTEYESTCDQFCKNPLRNETYRNIKKVFNK
jgi:hypothetical protein